MSNEWFVFIIIIVIVIITGVQMYVRMFH